MADDGFNWASFAPLAAAIGGSYITTNANNAAAERASAATLEGARIQAAAIADAQARRQAAADASAAAVREANARAIEQFRVQQQQAAPGVSFLRSVVADPGELTPLQKQQLADSRLATANTLHASTFAGSGRAGAALLQRNESDTINQMLEANRGRSMAAGTALAGESFKAGGQIGSTEANEGSQIANIETGSGQDITNLIAKGGQVTGDANTKAGIYGAQADLANGAVVGKAIGDIGSLVAKQGREGRYEAPTQQQPQNNYYINTNGNAQQSRVTNPIWIGNT